MARKRGRSPSPSLSSSETPSGSVFRSDPIADRNSTFQGLFSPDLSASHLASLPELKEAHHRMSASRRPGRQSKLNLTPTAGLSKEQGQTFETEFDDDGEKYGGKRCEKVLESMRIQGAVVVARWYGGVLLGPVRFTHIETCARGAVRAWLDARKAEQDSSRSEPRAKKVAITEEDKASLVQTLHERDTSIQVLRTLLADKKAALARHEQAVESTTVGGDATSTDKQVNPSQGSPNKTVAYDGMTLEALQRLERARDATIAFILKQIDTVEGQMSENG